MRPPSLTALVLIAGGVAFASRGGPVRAADPFTLVVRGRPRLRRDGRPPPPRRRGHPRRPHRGRRRPLAGEGQAPSSTPGGWPSPPASSTCCPGRRSRCIVDGRSQGEIRQGVTTEIFGEGESDGPADRRDEEAACGTSRATCSTRSTWTTLAEYLAYLEKKGVAPNVASYIGAATVREHVIGLDDRPATPARAGAHARPRAAGDGGGRPRHRVLAHLRARPSTPPPRS